jgi:hypothetical protein
MPDHKYKLSYKVTEVVAHPEGITAEQAHELAKTGFGTCDAVLIASILYPADGSYSVYFIPRDGRTGKDLSDLEMFKVWIMLANRLANSQTLDDARKLLAHITFQTYAEDFMGIGRRDN